MNLEIKSKLQSLLTAANAKTGESDATLTDAIQTLVDGYGQGGEDGGNYAKKTGTFTLESNYTYSNSAAGAYTGGILVDTGLLRIDALIVWSEEWEDDTEAANCFGLSLGFNNDIPVNNDYASSPYQQYSGMSFMRNGATRKYYGSELQGIIFHNATNGVPEGKFGLRCHSTAFPIIAGHTIHWAAWGVGDQDDLPIADGIVVKARDAKGNPTEVDYYGEILPPYCFGYNSYGGVDNPMVYVQKVNWKTTLKTIKGGAFYLSKLIELTIPETVTAITMSTSNFSSNMGSLVTLNYLSSVDLDYYSFSSCTALKTARMPNLSKLKNAAGNNTGVAPFFRCTALEDAEIGSVNHTITSIHSTSFYGCTQSGLTITVFTTSNYIDTILANLRNRATNATIIIKASEATTYNGTTYAAGDTILTSTP